MADTPPSRQDQQGAKIVSEHLPSGYSATFDGQSDNTAGQASSSAPNLTRPQEESSLKLQGGDIHRSLFKIDQRAKLGQRSKTFSHPQTSTASEDAEDVLTAGEQRLPGGFRREFIKRKKPILAARIPVTRNFVEFLDLYGSFAGEDLAESDDEAITDTEDEQEDEDANLPSERRPLLRRKSTKRAKAEGNAGTTKTFFTLLKAFIGTGIMFLPKAFNNGGIVFSSMTLISISLVSMLAFHLLLQCRSSIGGGGYGEIGHAIGGSKMRNIILGSITLSQLGFVCAGLVFVAQNLYSFSQAVAKRPDNSSPVSTNLLIALQLLVIIPLAFIRNISKLGPAALLADVFIMIGLVYIYWYDISTLALDGLEKTVVLFNPDYYTLTIGSCIFTFEGIGLILPIQSSMQKPQKFEWLLGTVMLIVTVIFCSVGALCYATFGSDTKIEVINNFPQTSKLVNAVQFLYSVAVLVGNPVQLFPAIRILENKVFKRSTPGSKSSATKWKKNAFRAFLACICGVVSILGSNDLDRFVALIGSFACVPLVYIYPPLLHYKGVADNKWSKAGDVLFIVLGVAMMAYTTVVTVLSSFVN
ncbi:hypothetical protein PMZ80_005164 [Knufia obscura]|uniref:Amino acid transporter transmembrane domain-containing protein n=2 Tax=Knufia TaxID=430999 RepID=A0AAN8IC09_9EURO|nr:hypothetical protein PMZ80_005164 [Knufia obscura]KAK5957831.1 hypothetical protein OHC33_001020 [Knufia fluminis]